MNDECSVLEAKSIVPHAESKAHTTNVALSSDDSSDHNAKRSVFYPTAQRKGNHYVMQVRSVRDETIESDVVIAAEKETHHSESNTQSMPPQIRRILDVNASSTAYVRAGFFGRYTDSALENSYREFVGANYCHRVKPIMYLGGLFAIVNGTEYAPDSWRTILLVTTPSILLLILVIYGLNLQRDRTKIIRVYLGLMASYYIVAMVGDFLKVVHSNNQRPLDVGAFICVLFTSLVRCDIKFVVLFNLIVIVAHFLRAILTWGISVAIQTTCVFISNTLLLTYTCYILDRRERRMFERRESISALETCIAEQRATTLEFLDQVVPLVFVDKLQLWDLDIHPIADSFQSVVLYVEAQLDTSFDTTESFEQHLCIYHQFHQKLLLKYSLHRVRPQGFGFYAVSSKSNKSKESYSEDVLNFIQDAILEFQQQFQKISMTGKIRFGISYGEMRFGILKSSRVVFDVSGQALNEAYTACQKSKWGSYKQYHGYSYITITDVLESSLRDDRSAQAVNHPSGLHEAKKFENPQMKSLEYLYGRDKVYGTRGGVNHIDKEIFDYKRKLFGIIPVYKYLNPVRESEYRIYQRSEENPKQARVYLLYGWAVSGLQIIIHLWFRKEAELYMNEHVSVIIYLQGIIMLPLLFFLLWIVWVSSSEANLREDRIETIVSSSKWFMIVAIGFQMLKNMLFYFLETRDKDEEVYFSIYLVMEADTITILLFCCWIIDNYFGVMLVFGYFLMTTVTRFSSSASDRVVEDLLSWFSEVVLSVFMVFSACYGREHFNRISYVEEKMKLESIRVFEKQVRFAKDLLQSVVSEEVMGLLESKTTVKAYKSIFIIYISNDDLVHKAKDMEPWAEYAILSEFYQDLDEMASKYGVQTLKIWATGCLMSSSFSGGLESKVQCMKFCLEVQDRIKKISARVECGLGIRMSLEEGDVSVGIFGRQGFVFDVVGQAVSTLYEIHASCPTNEIQVTENVRQTLECSREFSFQVIRRQNQKDKEMYTVGTTFDVNSQFLQLAPWVSGDS